MEKSFLLSSLPKRAAKLVLNIEKFIEGLGVEVKGKDFLLAYSGGADSKCLFYALLFLRPRMGFKLYLAHVDHSFRETSAREAKEAERLAIKYDIPYYIERFDVPKFAIENKIGGEEAGRLVRMDYFNQLKQELAGNDSLDNILLIQGHQLNDLAEDSIMRLMRGSSWPSLAGMRAFDADYGILRPLLLTSRDDIEFFLDDIGESFVDDPMNRDEAYLRNRVRAKLLPAFLAENPAFLGNVAERWRMAMLDSALFANETKKLLEYATLMGDELLFPIEKIRSLEGAMRMRLYHALLKRFGSGQTLAKTLRNLDRAIMKKRSGCTLQFPGNKLVAITRENLIFSKKR